MRRILLRWALFLLPAFFLWQRPLLAQQPIQIERGVGHLPPSETQSESNERNPTPVFVIAALMTIGVLVVVCMPSRKG